MFPGPPSPVPITAPGFMNGSHEYWYLVVAVLLGQGAVAVETVQKGRKMRSVAERLYVPGTNIAVLPLTSCMAGRWEKRTPRSRVRRRLTCHRSWTKASRATDDFFPSTRWPSV